MGSMKVHHLARGFISSSWDQEHQQQPSLSLTCSKRLRPLAPKLAATATTTSPPRHNHSTFDLKTFIRPESGPRKHLDHKQDPSQVEITQPGGTRWNPTQEQIGILEMLYREGMRTPNAQHIEQITAQLSRYGKIEGKNVFYWFQNHKARERQKQKRNASLSLSHSPPPTPTPITTAISLNIITRGEVLEREEEISPYKRKCRSWAFECLELEENKSCSRDEELEERTLELFPLHPEGR